MYYTQYVISSTGCRITRAQYSINIFKTTKFVKKILYRYVLKCIVCLQFCLSVYVFSMKIHNSILKKDIVLKFSLQIHRIIIYIVKKLLNRIFLFILFKNKFKPVQQFHQNSLMLTNTLQCLNTNITNSRTDVYIILVITNIFTEKITLEVSNQNQKHYFA